MSDKDRKQVAFWFAERESVFIDCRHVPPICVWKRSTVLLGNVFDPGLTGLSDMRKTTFRYVEVANVW